MLLAPFSRFLLACLFVLFLSVLHCSCCSYVHKKLLGLYLFFAQKLYLLLDAVELQKSHIHIHNSFVVVHTHMLLYSIWSICLRQWWKKAPTYMYTHYIKSVRLYCDCYCWSGILKPLPFVRPFTLFLPFASHKMFIRMCTTKVVLFRCTFHSSYTPFIHFDRKSICQN